MPEGRLRTTLKASTVPLLVAAGTFGSLFERWRFDRRLDRLEQQLDDTQIACVTRTDLPPAVRELATRLGAGSGHPGHTVELRQTGTMWFKPGGQPLAFTARQKIATTASGFVWRADIGPFGVIKVVDSFVAGRGYLEARLFGAFCVARIDDSAAINEGEALRYLAELPLNPDAILFDHALDWTVEGNGAIRVATGQGTLRAEIKFRIDEAGLIATASAASRTFDATGKRFPWHGRFWNYQKMNGHLIPMQAEVAWHIDGKDFIYWQGKMTEWVASGEKLGRG